MKRPDAIAPVTVPGNTPLADEVSTHPAFGMIDIARWSSGKGVKLHDSDILHHEAIVLTIHEAQRSRSIKHDRHFATKIIAQVEMSLAQWASAVSSMNTSGVPVTLRLVRDGQLNEMPGIIEDPRLGETMREAKDAAKQAFDKIVGYADTVDQLVENKASVREVREALRDLRIAIKNAVPNVDYATTTLSEHAENVVQRARADIEAMVTQHAERLGINPADAMKRELMP